MLVADEMRSNEQITITVSRYKSATWNLLCRNGVVDCSLEVGHVEAQVEL
jgi:hypothetical protein